MTPALAHGSVYCIETTRATICPSPVSGVPAKWQPSAVSQISVPEAIRLKRPFKKLASPAKPTLPMSACVQPGGNDGATGDKELIHSAMTATAFWSTSISGQRRHLQCRRRC